MRTVEIRRPHWPRAEARYIRLTERAAAAVVGDLQAVGWFNTIEVFDEATGEKVADPDRKAKP